MRDAIQELRTRARILQRRSDRRRLRECLGEVARQCGFPNWPAAKRALSGNGAVEDFGTLLWEKRCGGHFNRWYSNYETATEDRAMTNGYLLAYGRQYFVVDRYYIETLGLDPEDRDWQELGFDWVRPKDSAARSRIYAKLVNRLPRAA